VSSINDVRIKEIAERVRALVVARYGERIIDAAVGLGIGESELSTLLQGRPLAGRRDMLVGNLARVVRHFGVDPSWLVTGRYDVRSHVAAEERRADLVALRFHVHRLLSGPDWSVAMPRIERADQAPAGDAARWQLDWAEGPPAPYDPTAERANGRRDHGGEPDR
jgi:hypothetical protein